MRDLFQLWSSVLTNKQIHKIIECALRQPIQKANIFSTESPMEVIRSSSMLKKQISMLSMLTLKIKLRSSSQSTQQSKVITMIGITMFIGAEKQTLIGKFQLLYN
jgi:hypothetical protein